MKVGDIVKLRNNGRGGLITEKYSRSEADGNPNGDFTVYYLYKILFDTGTVVLRDLWQRVEIVNEKEVEVSNGN